VITGEFIPVVEQMGLSPELDRYILDLAIEELETSPSLSLAINISGLTAALPDWPGHIQDRLAGRPHVAKRLIVEITETAAVQDIEKIKILVQTLRHVGCQVSLDDFGAGSTSIRHLRELEFAIMKIDRDLLINVTTSEEQQHLVRTLIAMAHGLGMKSVAEGIENEDTARLRALVEETLRLRGFPSADFDQRLADISVDHPFVVEHYRAARQIWRDGDRAPDVDTEGLRQAMRHYHLVFAELVNASTEIPGRGERMTG